MYAAKALAAAIATVIQYFIWKEAGAPEEVEAAIFTIITAALVYIIPNRGARYE